jgi:Xaa-Pro aminopeptidase
VNFSSENLALLRAAEKLTGIDAYIIHVSDPHLGENIPDHWQIIAWLTGFDGSGGTVVVTDSFAGLWTDSRYFIQAEKQLEGSPFKHMRPGPVPEESYIDWLIQNTVERSRIALDGRIFSINQYRRLKARLGSKKVILKTDCDLITEIWASRPPLPSKPAFDHPEELSGKDRSVKITEVREQMRNLKVNYHLLTSVDDIMWLLNIRGSDVTYTPLLLSFAIIGQEQILLFAGENRIPRNLAQEFEKLGIVILPYEEITGVLSSLSAGSSLLISPHTTSAALYFSIPESVKIFEDISIPSRLKAVKNRVEIENIGRVMIKDGAAFTKFFFWIEHNLGQIPMSELSLAGRLLKLRSQNEDFLGPSFAPIIAFNQHTALPHYSAKTGTDSIIEENGILLIDSGGQYYGGTTDITRTISIGIPSLQQKTDFTLVLKGHINLALAKFPFGTRGYQLDMLARKHLWEQGLNYGHGTGHGVGYCLNVHEGPQNISPSGDKILIEAGMLISNEPALYREGEYGLRTENLILCYEDEETDFGQFLRFVTVSLCYIDKSLIDKSLLEQKEIDWLNSYHAEVYEKLSPNITEEERIWLREKTSEL